MRMLFPRESYYPKDAVVVDCNGTDAAVFVYDDANGKLYGIGFHGKAQKPDWHFQFLSTEQRDKRVHDFIEGRKGRAELMAQHKAERTKDRNLKLGDVLRASWGYDQTNIDFYEVTALVGKQSVEIREIGQAIINDSSMTGTCRPRPGNYVGSPMTRRVTHGDSVKIRSWGCWASLWAGGVSRWSSYA